MFTTLLILTTFGCNNGIKPITPTTGVTPPTTTTTGTNTGTTTATTTGTNTTTTTGTNPNLDCQADYTSLMRVPGSGPGPMCLTDEIQCGDVLLGTNEGGTYIYNRGVWEDAFALGGLALEADSILDGPERVFAYMGHSQGYTVTVTVESCVPMWGSWRRKSDLGDDWCQVVDMWDAPGHFTGSDTDQTYTFVNNTSGDYDYEIILDSYGGGEGNFKVSVECY